MRPAVGAGDGHLAGALGVQAECVGARGHLHLLPGAGSVVHVQREPTPVRPALDVAHPARTGPGPPDHVRDDDPVGLDVGIEDVVVVGPDAPFTGRGVELPLAHRVELRPVALVGDRHPLVVADAVPCEVGPAVPGVEHRVLLGPFDGHEEPGLGHVAVVHLRARHREVVRVVALDAALSGLEAVVDRGVPAVQVRGAHEVLAVELEHGVALAAVTVAADLDRRLRVERVGRAELGDERAGAALAVGEDQVVLAVLVGEDGLVTGARRRRVHDLALEVAESEIAGGRVALQEQHAVVVRGVPHLHREDVLAGVLVVRDAEAPHPSGGAEVAAQASEARRGRGDLVLERPVHQVL